MKLNGKSRTIYLLKRVEILLRNGLEAALQDTGVTVSQYVILSLLGRAPEASSAEISRRAGVTPQAIADTVVNFEARGVIERTRSAEHRRILKISLTEQGAALLADCEAKVDAFEQSLLVDFETSEVLALRNLLKRILNAGDGAVKATKLASGGDHEA